MKIAVAWILVVLFGAGVVWQFSRNVQQESQMASLRLQLDTAKTAETELQETSDRLRVAEEENKRLQSGNTELLRLRNQVRQLQAEKDAMAKQLQSGQVQLERAQNQAHTALSEAESMRAQTAAAAVQPAAATATNDALARFARRYGLSPEQVQQTPVATCVNTLRALEAAKMQWALEKNALPGANVTMADLQSYLGGQVTCPGGGSYQLNAVGVKPTCTIAGHALPAQ